MQVSGLYIALVVVIFAINVRVGNYFARDSAKIVSEYFRSLRNTPRRLASESIVAITCAVDAPLAMTRLTAIAGTTRNWLWWNMAVGGRLTRFLFAILRRRSGVLTELNIIEPHHNWKLATRRRVCAAYQRVNITNTLVGGWNQGRLKNLTLMLNAGR